MSKKILLILTILFLTTTLGVLVVGNYVKAADPSVTKCDKCPPGNKENIRMQIYIPGVTQSCTYTSMYKDNTGVLKPVVKDGKEVTGICYYIASNLPEYIKQLYNFSIGIIAIIAVIMIMIGGMEWIFAAGNPGTIGNAQTKIKSAIAGLILALTSWVILNTINPKLTNLEMTMPSEIGAIEQGTLWCANYPEYYKPNMPYAFCPADKVWSESGTGCWLREDTTTCGIKYNFGYREHPSGKYIELGKGETCYGSRCNAIGEACVGEMGYVYCRNIKEVCLNSNASNCDLLNDAVHKVTYKSDILNHSCKLRKDEPFGIDFINSDECTWDKIMVCPQGWERAGCFEGPKDTCWYEDHGKRMPANPDKKDSKYYCSDSLDANIGACSICCKKEKAEEYKLIANFSVYNPGVENMTVECKEAPSERECSDYVNKDSCRRNICKVNKTCEWQNNQCIEK